MTDKPDLPLSDIRAALNDAEDEVMQAPQRFRDLYRAKLRELVKERANG